MVAARRVFLQGGFHGASLDGIAEAAGYTKGAVYSNFENKDALFLAVLEEHFAQRAELYTSLVLDQPTIEDAYREVARLMVALDEGEPRWSSLVSEFATHAARVSSLRRAFVAVRERFIDEIARIIEDLAERHGVTYTLPARDIARGSGALARGMALERRLDPASVPLEVFAELHTAYMWGLTTQRNGARER